MTAPAYVNGVTPVPAQRGDLFPVGQDTSRYWDAASINALSKAVGELLTQAQQVAMATNYGLACDGVTDDYLALQALITAAGSKAMTLVIPGPCKVGTNITIPPTLPVRFEGAGAFTGAGTVTYSAIPTGANSASMVLATGSSTARTLAEHTADTMSVKSFGAKGDGSTDNVTAFTNAATWVNGGAGRTLYFPDGAYRYTGGLVFTSPVRLQGGPGAVLNYVGTGYAVKLGPDGLNSSTYQIGDYVISGLTFSGGATAQHGIYVNGFIVSSKIEFTRFQDFGPTTAGYWAVYFSGANWRASVSNTTWWNNSGPRNFIGTANDPNTKLDIIHIQASQSSHSGLGIQLNGWSNTISHSKIEGFTEAIILGSASGYSTLYDVYIEAFDTTGSYGAIGYDWAQSVVVRDCYANLHSNDLAGKGSFLYPRSGAARILGSTISGNRIVNLDASAFLVKMNAATAQNNAANNNNVNGTMPVAPAITRSSALSQWWGSDGDLPTANGVLSNISNTFTQTNYLNGETYFGANTHFNGVAFLDAYIGVANGKTITGYSDTFTTSKYILDAGTGVGAFTGVNITAGGSTTIGAGVGSVKMSSANAAVNAAWIPIKYNGTTYYVPAWTTNSP